MVVLDTNVVLDWLLFDDPVGRVIGCDIVGGALTWIATPAMRTEYFQVLGRARLAHWPRDADAHHRIWDSHCHLQLKPACSIAPTIRSADPDDQMFVELALQEGADWILSRDRALLDLAPALAQRGVRTLTPSGWVAARAGGQ